MTGTELAGFVGAFDPIIGAEIMTRLTTMGQMGVEQAELGMTATRAGIANTRANTAYTRARMDMLGSTGGGSGYGGSGSGGSDNASGTITNDEMNRAFVEGGFGVIQDGRPVFNLGYGNNQATWAAVRDWARNNPAIPLTAEEEQAAEWSAFNDILAQVRDLAGGDYLLIPGIIDDLLASGAITQEQADELMYYSGQ